MKQRILITRPTFPAVMDRLRQYFDVTLNEGPRYTTEQLNVALQDMDGALVSGGDKIDDNVLKGLSRLKAVCVTAAGYNNVDVAALTRAGVLGTNSPGPADEAVADFTWGLMIATARRLVEASFSIEKGEWKESFPIRFFGVNLCDKTLGILGMGGIGQAVARRAAGFRMTVIYHNRRRLAPEIEADCRARYRSKEELLREADYVVLAMPFTPENYHLIGAAELLLMKPTAMLFNVARGGLIDEAALADALRRKALAGAGLDVFEHEPAIDPGLMGLANAVLTPHIAGGTEETQEGLASMAADNLIAALTLGPQAVRRAAVINPEVLKL
ncbi:MAG TPA: D-glycerate dehydrogenase [Puia sp.]|jgi:lactate dehydrogenase-like 2-hydroxyacid dehydrogenase|nr:D-glycerate dehydrogenase [Puia sp.]